MEPQEFTFRRVRSVGDAFGDTFAFIRDNFSDFGKALVYIAVPALLAAGIASAFFMRKVMGGLFTPELLSGSDPTEAIEQMFSQFSSAGFFLTLLLGIVSGMVLFGVIFTFIHHKANGLPVDVSTIWTDIQEHIGMLFTSYVGGGIFVAVILMVAFPLMFIPCLGWAAWFVLLLFVGTIYLMIFPIRFEEGSGLIDSFFTRSRALLKGRWWQTAGLIILVMIVVVLLTMAVVLPFQMGMMGGFSPFSANPENMIQEMGTWFWVSQIVSSLASLLYVVPGTAIYLQYFSLVAEQESKTV